MTVAHDLLRQVEAVGGLAEARGGKLRLKAPRPLPDELMNALRRHKAEVLAALVAPCDTAEGLARLGTMSPPPDAERLAVEAAIARWLNEHPPHDVVADTCAGCGAALGPTGGLPLADGALVCEADACWREYVRKRRSEAEAAMSQ